MVARRRAVQADRAEGLIRTSARIAEMLELELVLEAIVAEAAGLLGVEGAGLRLIDGEALNVVASHGLARHVMRSGSLRVGESLSGLVVQGGEPVAVADLRADDRLVSAHKHGAIAHGVVSYLGVPLRRRGRIVGVLNVYGRTRRLFRDCDIRLLGAFADQAAVAIENARLYREATRRREQAEALAELARATASKELGEVLELALARILELVAAPSGIIYLRDHAEEILRVGAHRGFSPAFVAGVDRVRLGEGALGQVAALGRTERIDDVQAAANISRAVVREEGIRSVVIAPLCTRDRVIGAMYLAMRAVQPFTDEQVALLLAVGHQVAIAVEHARLLGAALESARDLARDSAQLGAPKSGRRLGTDQLRTGRRLRRPDVGCNEKSATQASGRVVAVS